MKSLLFFTFLITIQSQVYNQNNQLKPNVLFIICDDLNDYQGVFGGHLQAKTPNIDKLAKSGIQFL